MPRSIKQALKDVQDLAAAISREREAALHKQIKRRPRRSIHASAIPDCVRQGVYEFTHWMVKKLYSTKLQALFNKGNREEEDVVAELRKLRFKAIEQQSPLDPKFTERTGIGAYIDLKIKFAGWRIPIEVKSLHPSAFAKIKSLDDLKRTNFYRKWYRQVLIYIAGTGTLAGLFILTDCQGHWKFIPVPLNRKDLAAILDTVKQIRKFVRNGKLPERIKFDKKVCDPCKFKRVCIPRKKKGKLKGITDIPGAKVKTLEV